jgi:S-adenosylmethionine:tRNA ribosyltransferase-isomerase
LSKTTETLLLPSFKTTHTILTVKDIKIQDYTYVLPDERIAKFPLQERDASKLLIYKKGDISESRYRHIAAHIPADSCIFFNNTKVIPARLLFQRATGGVIEVFCLEPQYVHEGCFFRIDLIFE